MRARTSLRLAQPGWQSPTDSSVGAVASPIPARAIRIFAVFSALLLCIVDALALGWDNPRAAAIGYLSLSISLLACAAASWPHVRAATGLLRLRWYTFFAALLFASAAYAQCGPDLFGGNTTFLRPVQVACFNIGDALYILAVVLFFSGVTRSIVLVDMLQAILFAVLRFSLIYSDTTANHFSNNHLLISQLVALFFFLIALIAGLGAASPSERRYLRLLTVFFGMRALQFFLSDQVSYLWLNHLCCSLWDLPGTVFFAAFALYLLSTRNQRKSTAEPPPLRPPSLFVRSLMPSFLALGNLMLGLFALKVSVFFAASAISLTVVLYVARTVMLQGNAAQHNASLQLRNEQLEGLATRDHLTGIGNRRSLAAVYNTLQSASETAGIALFLMDIDQFKRANDLHGHLYGDEVLIALARTLEAVSAPLSHCARFGGDEFALLLSGVSTQQAIAIGESIMHTFANHKFQTTPPPTAGDRKVTLSLGLHRSETALDLPLETLIARADSALYRAKTQGRDRLESDTPHLPEAPIAETESTPWPCLLLTTDN